MASLLPTPADAPGALLRAWTCPECRRPLAATGGCAFCPACGYSPCG